MKASTLVKAIEKRGGKARLVFKHLDRGGKLIYVEGELNNHDIFFRGNGIDNDSSSFYTVRPFSKRGYYDPGSDYNPSDYTFCHTQKDLDWATK